MVGVDSVDRLRGESLHNVLEVSCCNDRGESQFHIIKNALDDLVSFFQEPEPVSSYSRAYDATPSGFGFRFSACENLAGLTLGFLSGFSPTLLRLLVGLSDSLVGFESCIREDAITELI